MNSNPDIYLSTENLTLGYSEEKGKLKLLQHGMNESLKEGDFICLLGPNGCGKSTLIRTLVGAQHPVNGKILIENREIHDLTNVEKSKYLSVVLTDNSAVGNITVFEIVALGRYNYTNWIGSLSNTDENKISEAIEDVSLSGFEDRKFNTLSDGEKQRTFIAKGLASDAPLMLLDEPTAHLDIPNRVGIMTLLRQLTRLSSRAVLVATHELDLALKLADEIWLMLPDKKMFRATPEELISSGKLDQVFGNDQLEFNTATGSYLMNTFPVASVVVEGKGDYLELTRQAVTRIGFTTEVLKDIRPIKIFVKDNQWKITDGRKTVETDNLANACRLLRMTGQ